MKLLIITQKVDQNDDILGFMHGWINEFAKHCDEITVIALGVGEHDLPGNVRVFSLGKEYGATRVEYVRNFLSIIWRERKNYDSVFVHMNQEYIILGALLWKIFGKKVALWRNHFAGNFVTRIAMALSDHIFCTSKFSFTARSPKTILMPVGVDTELFKKADDAKKIPHSILFLARISPAKKPELLIDAARELRDTGSTFTVNFFGDPLPQYIPYLNTLKTKVDEYGLTSMFDFHPGIPNTKTAPLYNSYEIFVNTSPSGMFDKTIFEAMACETLVLTSNVNLKGEIPDCFIFEEGNSEDLQKKLAYLLSLDEQARSLHGKNLRNYMSERHNLEMLAKSLVTHL